LWWVLVFWFLFFEIGFLQLFAQSWLWISVLQCSWSLPPEQLGLQAWAPCPARQSNFINANSSKSQMKKCL
jgi:hypothetical protein